MAIFTKKKLIGFLMDLVLWTIVAMKKLPDTEKTSNRPQKKGFTNPLYYWIQAVQCYWCSVHRRTNVCRHSWNCRISVVFSKLLSNSRSHLFFYNEKIVQNLHLTCTITVRCKIRTFVLQQQFLQL